MNLNLAILPGDGIGPEIIEQAMKAVTAKFMSKLEPDAPPFTKIVGRIGYAARAVVFFLIGYAIAKAAWSESGSQVKGIGGALSQLADEGIWFTLVAIGLIAFGIFSIVMARYRIIRDDDVIARLKAMG